MSKFTIVQRRSKSYNRTRSDSNDIDTQYDDVDIYYRVELVNEELNRVIILKDEISHSEIIENPDNSGIF